MDCWIGLIDRTAGQASWTKLFRKEQLIRPAERTAGQNCSGKDSWTELLRKGQLDKTAGKDNWTDQNSWIE